MTRQGGDQEDKGFEKDESVTHAASWTAEEYLEKGQVSSLGEPPTDDMTSSVWLESLGQLSEPVRVFCVPAIMLPLQLRQKTRQTKRQLSD